MHRVVDVRHDSLMHPALRKPIELVDLRPAHRNALLLREAHHIVEPVVRAERHAQRRDALRAQGFDYGVDAVDAHGSTLTEVLSVETRDVSLETSRKSGRALSVAENLRDAG